MKNAITWFEIPCRQLEKAQDFYEAILACKMRREAMGLCTGAVFPYADESGVGGAIICGPSAPTPGPGGTLVYLDASPSLDAVLARVAAAGGVVAMPRQALPPGMGFIARITDPDGNHVGLHALA